MGVGRAGQQTTNHNSLKNVVRKSINNVVQTGSLHQDTYSKYTEIKVIHHAISKRHRDKLKGATITTTKGGYL